MMLSTPQVGMIVVLVTVATLITRFTPFLLFSGKKQHPAIEYLGRTLPYAVVGLLVVFSLKDVRLADAAHGIPEALAILAIVLLHFWKRNVLLSIGAGTVIYMILIRLV
jgi:branched-subunit amino acid transport protein AzlD